MGVHDSLVKDVFGKPENAAGLLRSILPKRLLKLMDLSTLSPVPTTLQSVRSEFAVDLLFSVQLAGERALAMVLIEHQSKDAAGMPLRMLGYLVRVLEKHRAEHPNAELPVVIPVVFSHDPTGWGSATTLLQMYAPEVQRTASLRRLIPQCELFVEDLSKRSDAELQAFALAALAKAVLWALRDARRGREILLSFDTWAPTLLEVERAADGEQALLVLIRYILEATAARHHHGFERKLRYLQPQMGLKMISIADKLRREGRQEGLRSGQAELLRKQFQLKFGALTDAESERIGSAPAEQLDAWAERVLTAISREEFWR